MRVMWKGARGFYPHTSIKEMSTNKARLCPLPLALTNYWHILPTHLQEELVVVL